MKRQGLLGLATFAFALTANAAAAAVTVAAGSATGTPGSVVTIPVSLDPGDALVAGMQNDLGFDPSGVTIELVNGKPDCTANPDTGKSLGVSVRDGGSSMRALLFSLLDVAPMPAGLLYSCRFRVAGTAVAGTYPVASSNVAASDPSGQPISGVSGVGGIVTVTTTPPVEVAVGAATGMPGDTVSVSVSIASHGQSIAGVQNDIVFDPEAVAVAAPDGVPNCQVNSDLGKQLSAMLTADRVRVLVFAFDDLSPLPDGLLYTCNFVISPTATPGECPLQNTGVVVSDPAGTAVSSIGSSGSIVVTERLCGCDCNGDGAVTVDELVKAINIALDVRPLDACPAADIDGDGAVVVSEILAAVINAQAGCP